MSINPTFEQRFKTKLTNDLDNYITDRELEFVNDFGLVTDGDGKKVFATIVTGAGQRIVSTGDDNVQQTFTVLFYVPINYLQTTMQVLVDYGTNESALGNVQTLNNFTFYVNWQTPTTDGVPFKLGAYNYILISLTGTLLYSTGAISLGDTTIKINNVDLTNVITYAFNTQAITEQVPIAGINTNALIISGLVETLAVTILFDKTDTLHQQLLEYARNPVLTQSEITITLPTTTFKGALTVTTQESPNAFSYLKLDITRNDLYSEV
jgi:hypothetical protein